VPEGDTVWLAAERMRAVLAGEVLTRTDFRVPQYATVDLRGRRVLAVVPRGKHLLTRIEGGLTLHTHFEMDGSWHLYPAGAPWTGAGPQWQVRLVLSTAGTDVVGFRLPVIDLGPTAEEQEWVGHLGPDVLADDWSPDTAVANLGRDPGREIGTALLDQRNLAGPGNLYRTEALFLQGLSPWTRVADVPDLRRLVERTRRLMMVNRGRWEQATTGDTRRGRTHWVFQREGEPCRRCGTRIPAAMQGDPGVQRVTTWCPHCQPGPMPTPADVAAERQARSPRPKRQPTHRG